MGKRISAEGGKGMQVINTYKDLLTEIEIHKIIIENAENEKKQLIKLLHNNSPRDIKGISYSGMPGSGKNYISIDRIIDSIEKCENLIYIESNILEGLEKAKLEIENRIEKFEGLHYKVAYLRDIEGMKLQEIADRLGYSLDRIKQISVEIGKIYDKSS